MSLTVVAQGAPCGAIVHGVDLSKPLGVDVAAETRRHWLAHQVLGFPGQAMTVQDLERFAATLGPFGVDPSFEPIAGHPHVAQVKREADEASPIFAESWHSDWSFLARPPAATVLYGDVIASVGGDNLVRRPIRCLGGSARGAEGEAGGPPGHSLGAARLCAGRPLR